MDLSGFTPEFQAALGPFLNAAPGEIGITSGYRDIATQERLWQAALEKYGSPEAARKWVAPPGSSRHNYGQAADLNFASPEVREWAHANAAEHGLTFPMSWEPWHIESVGARGGVMAGAAPGPTAPQGTPAPTGPGNVLAAAPDGTGGQDETMQKLALFNALRGRGQQQQDPRAFMSQPNALAILPFTNRIG